MKEGVNMDIVTNTMATLFVFSQIIIIIIIINLIYKASFMT